MKCLLAFKRFGIFVNLKSWILLGFILRSKAIEIYFLCFALVIDRKEKQQKKKLKKGWNEL